MTDAYDDVELGRVGNGDGDDPDVDFGVVVDQHSYRHHAMVHYRQQQSRATQHAR